MRGLRVIPAKDFPAQARLETMSVTIHIGPPKTATTSLQNSVIPHLGVPFEIKPEWSRTLARAPVVDLSARTERHLIVSEEGLGDFTRLPPETVAERLARVFARGVVVFCVRDPCDQFYSLYRQRLINSASLQVQGRCPSDGLSLSPASPEEYLHLQWQEYRTRGLGFFASVDVDRIRAAFGRYFAVRTIDFGLLSHGTQGFVRAFTEACGLSADASLDLSCDNVTSAATLEAVLIQLPVAAAGLKDLYRRFFTARLSAEQEAFLAAFRGRGLGDTRFEAEAQRVPRPSLKEQ